MEAVFNQKLMDFIKDLSALNANLVRPVPELAMLESGTQLMAAVDQGGPLRLFRQYVSVPYGNEIESRDDKFFLDSSKIDECHNNDINLVNMLRSVWKTLTAQDRNAIWDHMQLLLKIDKKIAEKQ